MSDSPRPLSGTILVVDDEPFVLNVIDVVLRNAGYRVIRASGADDAVLAASTCPEPIDLLIADVLMPGTNGPELATNLLQDHPHLRVLFIAGLPDTPLIHNYVIRRGHEFLPKPFVPGVLLRKVETVLRGRAMAACGSAKPA